MYVPQTPLEFITRSTFSNREFALGDYIILDYVFMGHADRNPQKHEYGHHVQSIRLGWFYLLLIGLPSFACNVWDRLFHKKWEFNKRTNWYYSLPIERNADFLGGVLCRIKS